MMVNKFVDQNAPASVTEFIYAPAPSSFSTVARNKRAIGQKVSVSFRRTIGRNETFCEISHQTMGFLGMVPKTDLFPVINGKMTKKVEIELLKRIIMLKKLAKKGAKKS